MVNTVYTKTATDAAISTAIANLVGSASSALDTLQEIDGQLTADEGAAAALAAAVAGKEPAGLSTATKATLAATYATKAATQDLTPIASLQLAAAPASPAVYTGDTFAGASGALNGRVSNQGQFALWSVPAGSFTLASGAATVTAPGTTKQLAVLLPAKPTTAYSVAALLRTATTSATVKSIPGLVFRYQDVGNYWYVSLTAAPNGSGVNGEGFVNLVRVQAGIAVRRAAVQTLPTGLTISDAAAHTVRVDIDGADITIVVDGYDLGTFPEYDVNPAAPKVGFLHTAAGAPTTSASFAALAVTAYAGPRFNWPKVETPKPAAALVPYVYVGDDFTGAAGEVNGRTANLNTARTWTSSPGQWVLTGSGSLTPNVGTDGILAILTDTAAPSTTPRIYQFTATAAGSAQAVKSVPGLVIRYQDSSNFWYCYFDPADTGGSLFLRQKSSSNGDQLIRAISDLAIGFGQPVTVQLADTGTTITMSIPNTPFAQSVTDSTFNTSAAFGVRHGYAGNPGAFMTIDDLRVTQNPAPISGSPDPSTQIIPLGTSGSWEDTDVNNPNVVWDPNGRRWVCYYSGNHGGNQQMGLAYAQNLTGPWTRDPANPIAIPGPDGQNGALAYKDGVWYHLSWGAGIDLYTSPDLHTWTRGAHLVDDGNDPFLRVTQTGALEAWYGTGYPNAQIYRMISTDNGVTWAAPQVMVTAPPGWGTFGGNGEPTVYVPPGREGSQYLVFCDEVDFVATDINTRSIISALTVDGGTTWHWRRLVQGSGSGWDASSKFDSDPVYAEGAFHLFHGAAPVSGIGLDVAITVGHTSVQWSPYNSLAPTPA